MKELHPVRPDRSRQSSSHDHRPHKSIPRKAGRLAAHDNTVHTGIWRRKHHSLLHGIRNISQIKAQKIRRALPYQLHGIHIGIRRNKPKLQSGKFGHLL